eukprot:TCONS_00037961-protein
MAKIVEGMGSFWKNAGPTSLDAIYQCTIPNQDNLIRACHAEEKCRTDQKLTTWLHCFIRACDFEYLLRLIRFISGSHSVYPHLKISIQFVNNTHAYPYSKTCFKILYLPRSYTSFRHFRDKMLATLRNEELLPVADKLELQ